MTNDRKLAVVVRDDLATWQELNVTAFLVSGVGSIEPGLVGERYRDGSDVEYLPMFVTPVVVLAGDAAAVRRGFDRALTRGLAVAVYTDDLFATGNDVDKALDKLRLHP